MNFLTSLESGCDFSVSMSSHYGRREKCGFYPFLLRIDVELSHNKDGIYILSISAYLASGKRDVELAGQCLDDAKSFLKDNGLECQLLNELIPIWRKWHLNDMKAGSPAQEEELDKYRKKHPGEHLTYEKMRKILDEKSLLIDESYLKNGKPYQFGTSWLTQEIPYGVLVKLCKILDNGNNNRIKRIKVK